MSEGLTFVYGLRKMARLYLGVAPSEVYLGLSSSRLDLVLGGSIANHNLKENTNPSLSQEDS
jgi:hypothetical protein